MIWRDAFDDFTCYYNSLSFGLYDDKPSIGLKFYADYVDEDNQPPVPNAIIVYFVKADGDYKIDYFDIYGDL